MLHSGADLDSGVDAFGSPWFLIVFLYTQVTQQLLVIMCASFGRVFCLFFLALSGYAGISSSDYGRARLKDLAKANIGRLVDTGSSLSSEHSELLASRVDVFFMVV